MTQETSQRCRFWIPGELELVFDSDRLQASELEAIAALVTEFMDSRHKKGLTTERLPRSEDTGSRPMAFDETGWSEIVERGDADVVVEYNARVNAEAAAENVERILKGPEH